MTLCQSRGEPFDGAQDRPGGAKAQRRKVSMSCTALGTARKFFPRRSLYKRSLKAAPSHKSIAFAQEGSRLDCCHL